MTRNQMHFWMIVLSIIVISGGAYLIAFVALGSLQLKGVALGAGFGLWIALPYFLGRALSAAGEARRWTKAALNFAIVLVIGVAYYFGLQKPYIDSRVKDGFAVACLEQAAGILWAGALAYVPLVYWQYKAGNK